MADWLQGCARALSFFGGVAQLIAETATQHVIEDIVDDNFGPDVPAPVIEFGEIGMRQSDLDRAREAAGLTSDGELVKFLRTHSNPEES